YTTMPPLQYGSQKGTVRPLQTGQPTKPIPAFFLQKRENAPRRTAWGRTLCRGDLLQRKTQRNPLGFCETRRKRLEPTVSHRNRQKPKKADNESDNDNDKDKDKDSDNENEKAAAFSSSWPGPAAGAGGGWKKAFCLDAKAPPAWGYRGGLSLQEVRMSAIAHC
ncbi:MAG: hypothetical protein LUF86_02290, partial [Clostridiales bacterium]|nr:hypothetical protein [Clostridiales bacterium]